MSVQHLASKRAVRPTPVTLGIVGSILCSLAVGGCATHRRARMDLPPNERGVAELGDLVQQLKQAAAERDLEKAYDVLEELEEGTVNADPVTESHPDFADLEQMVRRARPALDAFAERDRQQRRAAAVAALLERLAAVVARGREIAGACSGRVATDAELTELEDSLELVDDILSDGEEFADDATYSASLQKVRPEIAALEQRFFATRWARTAADEVGRPLRRALEAEHAASLASDLDTRVDADERALRDFERCIDRVQELRGQDGYTNDVRIASALGELSIEELSLNCHLRREESRRRVTTGHWRQAVAAISADIDEAVSLAARPGSNSQRLAAVSEASRSLEQSTGKLRRSERMQGFDASAQFQNTLGRFSATALREACAAEARRLDELAARLRWNVDLETVASRATEARNQIRAARGAPTRKDRVASLGLAVGGFEECVERCSHLSRRRAPAVHQMSPGSRAALDDLAKKCRLEHAEARKLLDRARRTARM